MDLIRYDLLLAARSLFRRPGLMVAALLTLSLGVGAATSVFSVLYGVIIQPLPYPDSEQLLRLYTDTKDSTRGPWSGANFVDFKEQSSVYEAIAGFQYADHSMLTKSFPVRVRAATVTADFFKVFGMQPSDGRTFLASNTAEQPEQTVVLSHGFWQEQLAGEPVAGT